MLLDNIVQLGSPSSSIARPGQTSDPHSAGHPGVSSPGVLVVDDDRSVQALLDVVLRQHGFAVWLTADGYQALKVYEGRRQDIDLVLIDVRMTGYDSPETLAALQRLNPEVRCCFMNGDLGRYTEQRLLERGAERVFYKPFRLEEFTRVAQELVRASPHVHLCAAAR